MIRLKGTLRLCGLFALLLAAVSAPALLPVLQKGPLLNETVLYSVEAVQLGGSGEERGERPAAGSLSVWERIKVLGTSAPTAVRERPVNTEAQAGGIRAALEEQLRSLMSFSALPEFSFSDAVSVSYEKETYMPMPSEGYVDLLKPDGVIDVWKIRADDGDVCVLAYMDAELSVIYDLTVSSPTFHYSENSLSECSAASEVGFLNYLLTFSHGGEQSGDVFSAGGVCAEGMICLYPISVDEGTGEMVAYRVGGLRGMEASTLAE